MSKILKISHKFYLNYITTKQCFKYIEADSAQELKDKIVDVERRTIYTLRIRKIKEDENKQIGRIETDFSGILVGSGELIERLERYKE